MEARATRRKFLESSRARLSENLADLNHRFEIEVRRLREEILAARALRGEVREASLANNEGGQASRAAQAAADLQQQQNEEVKRLVGEAVRVSPKGRRVRDLMAQIEQAEQRITAIDSELGVLEG